MDGTRRKFQKFPQNLKKERVQPPPPGQRRSRTLQALQEEQQDWDDPQGAPRDAHLGLSSGFIPTPPRGRDRPGEESESGDFGVSFILKLSAYGGGDGEFWDAPSATETQDCKEEQS